MVKIGDVFYTSWGYDQTNYNFIVIVDLSKTGKTAICRMSEAPIVDNSRTIDNLKPNGKPYGDKFRMKVCEYNGKPELRGSYPYIRGDISIAKRFDSFWIVDNNRTYGQTNPMFGH